MSKGTKLDCLPDELPLNEKLYKYEDGQLYIKTPKEPVYYNLSDILTKKDVLKLLDIVGTMTQLTCSCRKDHEVVHSGLEYLSDELVKLRKELTKE